MTTSEPHETLPMTKTSHCHRCKAAWPADLVAPVAMAIKVFVAFSLAPVHAGNWTWIVLSQNYCTSCRRRLTAGSISVAVGMLALVAYGFHWLLKSGLLR